MTHPLQKSGTCAASIIYAICFCAALILRTCEPHSAYVQNVRRKQNIGHMCKMCAGDIHMQYVCSLRTILKICAKYAQFAHNPQDMCKICAVCAHKKERKKKYSTGCWSPVQALGTSKHWADPMFENRCFECGMVSDTYSYSRRPFICAATLPKVSVLIVCNGNSSMSWVKRSGSFKYN